MTDSEQATVLVVDDDKRVTELFGRWLEDDYDVYKALDGTEALRILEDEHIDVVLLDRRMPGLSGDDVLETMTDQGMDCQIAMVTAVEPDVDIVEMGFDDYVVKPPSREELNRTVQSLLERRKYPERRQEYWSLLSKRAVLERQMSDSELAESDEYAELQSQIDRVEDELEAGHERMADDVEFLSTIRDIESNLESEE